MSQQVWLALAAGTAGLAVWIRVGALPPPDQGPAGSATGWQRGWSAVLGAAGRWWVRHRAGSRASGTALLDALAAELAAGQPPALALESAASALTPDPCPRTRRALLVGASVPDALRSDARAGGGASLRGLAACWQVAEESGAGLAVAVTRLADGQRAAQDARDQLSAELAAVRVSARLLGVLPLLGLAMGHLLGAQPLLWLTGSWLGVGVLGAGVALQLLGLAWLRRIVRAVETDL